MKDRNVDRKTDHVLITGASSGLGAALAERYAARGASLTLLARNRDRLEAVAERCRAWSATVDVACCDVRDVEAMSTLVGGADQMRPVTLVIANAGLGGRSALVERGMERPDAARNMIATNVVGLVNTIAPVLPRLIERRSGHIAVVSSLAGYSGLPQAPAYAASKAAARVYGEGLRRLLLPSGIGVTVVCPGFIDTPMSASLSTPRPFLISAADAAARIERAIARQAPELVFPWPLALAVKLDRWLPVGLGDRLMSAAAAWGGRR